MKKDKLIGIIIPVYNVEQYIRQCLDSILEQDYQNYIVLLVDDGSTDLSVNAIEEYLKKDKRFVLIKKSNGGLSSALNAGINYFYQLEKDNLKIDYLIFLDGDDYWDKNCLSQCVCNMEGVQAVWFDYRYIFDGIKPYDNDCTRMDYLGYKKEQIITPMDFFKRVFITKEWHAFAKMGMINFDFLKSIKLEFKEGLFLEDHLFGVIFFASSHKIKVLPLKLYNYRIRANSLCNYNKNKNSTFMPAYFHKKYNSILYDQKKYDELGSKLTIGLELEKFIYDYPNKKINFLIKNFLIEYYFQESSELLLFPVDPLDYSSNLLNRPSVSAKRIIKESLEYRIGYVCKNIRNFTKCFNLLKNANQKSNYDLTVCTDYQESLKLKNHLNFILGKNIIMIYNKIERLFILLYPLIFIYSYCEFIFKKKYKPIANN
ncbi:glycosyltransferase family 2 protein, partial [Campylobacter jejuni]